MPTIPWRVMGPRPWELVCFAIDGDGPVGKCGWSWFTYQPIFFPRPWIATRIFLFFFKNGWQPGLKPKNLVIEGDDAVTWQLSKVQTLISNKFLWKTKNCNNSFEICHGSPTVHKLDSKANISTLMVVRLGDSCIPLVASFAINLLKRFLTVWSS